MPGTTLAPCHPLNMYGREKAVLIRRRRKEMEAWSGGCLPEDPVLARDRVRSYTQGPDSGPCGCCHWVPDPLFW